jgi:hypothetical protein
MMLQEGLRVDRAVQKRGGQSYCEDYYRLLHEMLEQQQDETEKKKIDRLEAIN